jgi:hypothetical protein
MKKPEMDKNIRLERLTIEPASVRLFSSADDKSQDFLDMLEKHQMSIAKIPYMFMDEGIDDKGDHVLTCVIDKKRHHRKEDWRLLKNAFCITLSNNGKKDYIQSVDLIACYSILRDNPIPAMNIGEGKFGSCDPGKEKTVKIAYGYDVTSETSLNVENI